MIGGVSLVAGPPAPGGPRSRHALADFRVTGAWLLQVLAQRSVGAGDQRLQRGDPAAHAGPGRDVVDAYAPAVDWGTGSGSARDN
jgi:hypothetical protein